MKIFTFKRLLGLVAIGGGVAYVRQQGGVSNALESLKKLVSGTGGKPADKAFGSSSRAAGEHRPGRFPSASVPPNH